MVTVQKTAIVFFGDFVCNLWLSFQKNIRRTKLNSSFWIYTFILVVTIMMLFL